MRSLYVHVGLHKTGTSSIQSFFNEHREYLRSCGLLYPLAGIVPAYPGHHNLAWELAGDRRFDHRRGTFRSLFSEIRAFDGDVLISSEDFEGVLGYSHCWTALREFAQRFGFVIKLVIFLREQAAYLESLYLQNLVLGCGECFIRDFEDCLSHGEFRKRDWRFHFDYLKLVTALKGYGFDELIVRDYNAASYRNTVNDICEVINLPPAVRTELKQSHKNSRRSLLEYLTKFHENRLPDRKLVRSHKYFHVMAEGVGRVSIVSPLLSQVHDRFSVGNIALLQEFNLPSLANLSIDMSQSAEGASDIARVFSSETSLLLRRWLGKGYIALDEHRRWLDWINHFRLAAIF